MNKVYKLFKLIILALFFFWLGVMVSRDLVQAAPLVEGDKVTCTCPTVKSYFSGEEFVEDTELKCTVVKAGIVEDTYEVPYQQIKVDCSKDLESKWTSRKGMGIVKNHKLNPKVRWLSTNSCYKGWYY